MDSNDNYDKEKSADGKKVALKATCTFPVITDADWKNFTWNEIWKFQYQHTQIKIEEVRE